MRNCALWITPWVDPRQDVILDTSATTPDERRAAALDGDDMPADTVLVLIHPARYEELRDAMAKTLRFWIDVPVSYSPDEIGRYAAQHLVDARCRKDPELRRRLRW